MSSKRRIRRKECEGKVGHTSRENALVACRHTGAGMRSGLGVYKCKWCERWHVGHSRGSRFMISSHLAKAVLYHD